MDACQAMPYHGSICSTACLFYFGILLCHTKVVESSKENLMHRRWCSRLTLSFRQGHKKIGNETQHSTVTQHHLKIPTTSTHHPHIQKSSLTHAQHRHRPFYPYCPITIAAVDPGEVFIKDLLLTPAEHHENTEKLDVHDTEDFDNDASQFTTASINSAPEGVISKDHA